MKLAILPTKIPEVVIVEPMYHEDFRGFFATVFDLGEFRKFIPHLDVIQINRSLTKQRGTIRGLHFQKPPRAQDKIVQCVQGSVYDVALDIRPESKTYKQWIAVELSEKNRRMLIVPKGFAHGFQALRENCVVEYFVSDVYAPELESGVRWNDPSFNFTWPIKNPEMTDKDKNWPLWRDNS